MPIWDSTPLRMGQGTAGAAASVYTSPAVTKTILKEVHLFNRDAGNGGNFYMWIVPSGGSRQDNNMFMAVTMTGWSILSNVFSAVMEAGDALHVSAGGQGDINYYFSGVKSVSLS